MVEDRTIQLAQLALAHGQVRWILTYLGLRVGDSEAQFDAWLKYVRRVGVPFYPNELGRGAGVNVTYRFHHVMELAVALALRTQGILPRDLLGLLAQQRLALRPLYHRAYLEHDRGLGAPLQLRFAEQGRGLVVQGTFLELQLDYLAGGVLTATEPRLLGPEDAVRRFLRQDSLRH